jgi:hypothetical protein
MAQDVLKTGTPRNVPQSLKAHLPTSDLCPISRSANIGHELVSVSIVMKMTTME